jgi:flavin-binding protein dodecin
VASGLEKPGRRHGMSVVKIIELVGESPVGWEDAMKQVIEEAQKTLRGITRIGVIEQDVRMINDKIDVWRVWARVSFRVERPVQTGVESTTAV